MWEQWQDKVKLNLPNFCQSPLYVAQDIPIEEFENIAPIIAEMTVDLGDQTLGEEYGATVIETQKMGRVTRMWVDAMCEVNFLHKYLQLDELHVLDIGAGYGRLAAYMEGLVNTYTCTDVVPISLFICEYFCMKHAPGVMVRKPEALNWPYDLAINIHSWSEASLKSVAEWLALLKKHDTEYLFTVPHDNNYNAWGPGGSFRPLIEADFELIVERKMGLKDYPHSLWKRK